MKMAKISSEGTFLDGELIQLIVQFVNCIIKMVILKQKVLF